MEKICSPFVKSIFNLPVIPITDLFYQCQPQSGTGRLGEAVANRLNNWSALQGRAYQYWQ